jgi:inositol phosphorylceramide mannosyltransferase catalytic subunit
MSESTLQLTETVRQANPGFIWRLGGNDDLTAANFSLLPLIHQAKSYAQVADLMRLEILQRHGGVYFDTDFEGLSSIEPLLHYADLQDRDVIVCHEEENSRAMSNSWIAAQPGAQALTMAVNHLKQHGFDASKAENVSTGPFFWGKWYKESPYIRLPTRTFYPYAWNESPILNDATKETWAQQGTFAIHHWAKSWHTK